MKKSLILSFLLFSTAFLLAQNVNNMTKTTGDGKIVVTTGTGQSGYTTVSDIVAKNNQAINLQASGEFGNFNNVLYYTRDNLAIGAHVIETNINHNSDNMFRVHVSGYDYGNGKFIDFIVIGYTYNGPVLGNIDTTVKSLYIYSLNDMGNDALLKRIGINQNGKVCISLGDVNTNLYYVRFKIDYTGTLWNVRDSEKGWSVSLSTQPNFGWKDIHLMANNNKKAEPARIYPNDSAADSDVTLKSGDFYCISGNRNVYRKP